MILHLILNLQHTSDQVDIENTDFKDCSKLSNLDTTSDIVALILPHIRLWSI